MSAEQIKPHGVSKRPRTVSYAVRLSLTGVLVALVTSIISFILLAATLTHLNQNFEEDTAERCAAVARATANILSQRYESVGGWTPSTIEALPNISRLSEGIGIEVVASDGNIIYRDPLITTAAAGVVDGEAGGLPEGAAEDAAVGAAEDAANGAVEDTAVGAADDAAEEPPAAGAAAGATEKPPVAAALLIVEGVQVGTVFTYALPGAASSRMEAGIRVNIYMSVLIAGLIAVTLAALFGVFFSRSFIRPLTHITTISNRVQAGDLSARTSMEGSDEFSRLGRAVDDMIDAVEKNKKLEHQLTTDVAHELRTPLMAMQATIEAMADGVLPVDSIRLATLNAEVIRLGRLVDVQLELSRLESGSTALRIEVLDLSRLAEDLVILHEVFVEEAGLIIDYEITPGIMVRGDADLLRQAISNLLSNAVRYTASGGNISVRVCSQRSLAQVFVSDTGIGIAAEDMQHVFSRFWRAATSRALESGGLGVGLSMVKEIAAKHRGIISVESEPGIGSTFTLSLPLFEQEDSHEQD
jgi:signal transduction histidine kinase